MRGGSLLQFLAAASFVTPNRRLSSIHSQHQERQPAPGDSQADLGAVMVNRRVVLSALAGVVGAGAAGSSVGSSLAVAADGRFRRVVVDVEPLIRKGLGGFAGSVRSKLTQALQQAFAGRLGVRNAPDLTVRITAVQLAMWAGNDGGERFDFSGGGSTDYMEGEALIMDGRRVIARHPQLSALPSSSGGAWYRQDVDQRRTEALCEHYAGWLARAL